jgi:hypothetical protein
MYCLAQMYLEIFELAGEVRSTRNAGCCRSGLIFTCIPLLAKIARVLLSNSSAPRTLPAQLHSSSTRHSL